MNEKFSFSVKQFAYIYILFFCLSLFSVFISFEFFNTHLYFIVFINLILIVMIINIKKKKIIYSNEYIAVGVDSDKKIKFKTIILWDRISCVAMNQAGIITISSEGHMAKFPRKDCVIFGKNLIGYDKLVTKIIKRVPRELLDEKIIELLKN